MAAISSFGAYIPRLRLSHRAVVEANGWFNGALRAAAGAERAICSWDEDAITLAVDAGRDALDGPRDRFRALYFATTSAPFEDRQNAGIIAQALGLAADLKTMDVGGSLRAGTTALLAGLDTVAAGGGDVLCIAADRRRAAGASAAELLYGDGAAALTLSRADGIATFLGSASSSVDFVDHYKGKGREFDYSWEERWIRDEGYLGLVPKVVSRLLEQTGVAAAEIAHFVMPCTLPRVGPTVVRAIGLSEASVRPTLDGSCGDTGAAHALLMFVNALEVARPGDKILVVGFAQGCDALLFQATDALPAARSRHRGVGGSLALRRGEAGYAKYLAFNDLMAVDRGLRSEVDKQTPLSLLYRNRDMLLSLVGGRCERCGTVQFPRSRICVNPNCRAADEQSDQPFADFDGRVMSFTVDRLTYTPEPPAYYGLVQFDGGGRMMIDFTDVDEAALAVGTRMRLVFRIRETDPARGFIRYFWKATPVVAAERD